MAGKALKLVQPYCPWLKRTLEEVKSEPKSVCYSCGSDKTGMNKYKGKPVPCWINKQGHTYCKTCYYRIFQAPAYRDKRLQTYAIQGKDKKRQYYETNKERILDYKSKHFQMDKDRIRLQKLEYRKANREAMRSKAKERYKVNKTPMNKGNKKHYAKQRLAVLQYYSNGKLMCDCCGETIYEFLTIDHINNDGNIQVKLYGRGKLYRWLIKNNFPEGYRVWCYNCNCSRGRYGYCPHEKLREINATAHSPFSRLTGSI